MLFARVLVQEAAALLLDEPTANLDITHRERIFGLAPRPPRAAARWWRRSTTSTRPRRTARAWCCSTAAAWPPTARPEAVLRPEVLEPVYGVRAVVSRSRATGALLVEVLRRP